MGLRFLLDQNVEHVLSAKLEGAGHDVERVVDVPGLGAGAADEAIVEYANDRDRIVLTYDSDFTTVRPDSHAGVFFVPDQRLSAHDVFSIVQAVIRYHDGRESMAPVIFLTHAWL